MHQDLNSLVRLPFPGTSGKKKTFAYDTVWGRPVFRAPELLSPHVIFDPLPFRFLSGDRTHPTPGGPR